MFPLDKEIRKLDLNEVVKLSDILDPFNGWKKLMAVIPEDLEDENCNKVKYSSEDFQLIEQAKEQQLRSCTSILIDEWGTSGKVRPRLSNLKKLLEKSELYRAADYVAELLNEPPSERPQEGPSAKVKIPDTDQLLQINKTSVPSLSVSPETLSQIEGCPVLSTPSSNQLDTLAEVGDSLQGRSTRPCTSIAQDFPLFGDEVIDLPYRAFVEATDNFSDENRLGKGACGTVYLATVNPGNRKIAIKRLHEGGVPGGADRQFRSEITTISKINHPNLLRLLGFSTDGDSLCLVYPYMPNGSLCDLLATEESRKRLPWNLRLKIASGVASGIAHLHSMQPRPLIHRDIKTANVLLDDDMIPKLCDFGLIRVSSDDTSRTTSLTTTIIGTSAYMASEAFRGEISVKMDIFSFGVILLELLTGLPPTDDDGPLVDTIFDKTIDCNGTCEFLMDNLVDTTAGDWGGDWKNGVANRFLKVAIDCIAAEKRRRPNIETVVEQLDKINRDIP